MSDRSRRAVLASLAAGSVSLLAGCNSTSNSGSDPNGTASGTGTADTQPTQTQSSNSSGVIKDTTITTKETTTDLGITKDETFLRVSVTDAAIDAVALRNSDGKEITRKQLGTGTTTQFPLTDRAADTYDILAIKDGSIVDELSKTFKREFNVDGVSFVTEEGTSSDKAGYTQVRTTITNTGNLPVTIPYYDIHGDGPTPGKGSRAPIGDSEDDTKPMVPPGESQTLTSQTSPLAALGSNISCSGGRKTGKITVETKAGDTTTISFEYSLSGEKIGIGVLDGCTESTIYSWNVTENE